MTEPKIDGRRRRWISLDVHLYSSNTGSTIYAEFGSAGLALFIGMLQLAKRSPTEGQIVFVNEADLLAQIGLHGLNMVDEVGDKWELDRFIRRLGDMKQIRKTLRGRTKVVSISHWGDWQHLRGTSAGRDESARSAPTITDAIPTQSEHNAAPIGRVTAPDKTMTRQDIKKGYPQKNNYPSPDTTSAALALGAIADARQTNPCPKCDGNGLIEVEGQGMAQCEACGATGVAA